MSDVSLLCAQTLWCVVKLFATPQESCVGIYCELQAGMLGGFHLLWGSLQAGIEPISLASSARRCRHIDQAYSVLQEPPGKPKMSGVGS